MLEALRRWLWPAMPFKITYRFQRRDIDDIGTAALYAYYTEDARDSARYEGWTVDETWTQEATLLDIYRVDQARPDDVLQLTVKLSPPT